MLGSRGPHVIRMNQARTTSGKSWRAAMIIVVVAAVALAIRVHRIGDRSLWEDELSTWTSIRGTVMEGIHYVQMPHPPLYSLSCRVAAWGDPRPSEVRLRLPAAIYGTLAILAGGWLGATLFDRRVGWAMLAVLAVNAFLIRYSREARMYSLLVLTTTLSMGFWYRLVMRRKPADAAGYVISTVAMLYSHYFASLAMLAQFLWLLLLRGLARLGPDDRGAAPVGAVHPAPHEHPRPASPPLLMPLLGMGIAAAAFAPLAVFFVRYILPNKLGWIRPASLDQYLAFFGDVVFGPQRSAGAVNAGAALGCVVVVGLLASAIRCLRGGRWPRADGADPVPARALVLLWVLCVVGGLAAISGLGHPVFVPRYAISALMPCLLAMLTLLPEGQGVRSVVPGAVLVLMNAASLATTVLHEPPPPNGLAGIVHHLNAAAARHDAVVVIDFPFCPNYRNPVEMGFEYYGLRPDLAVLRMRGDQKTGRLVDTQALADPRNLHIVTLLGDIDPELAASGRRYQTYLFEPYRYVVVYGPAGTPPPRTPRGLP